MNYRIFPPQGLPEATIHLPLSKSVSNRQLIINALTADAEPLTELADCSDTRAMRLAFETLGEVRVDQHAELNVGGAGTAMRFLTAYLAAQPGLEATIDGDERMRHRPIAPLVKALRACGAEIEYLGEEGFPPLKINGKQLAGGEIAVDSTVSSQFVSALLMVAPTMTAPLTLKLEGEPASRGYINLTVSLMEQAGAKVDADRDRIIVEPGRYAACAMKGERDWSAASYWYEIEALTSGFVTLPGLDGGSRQPDRAAEQLFADLGVQTDFEGDEDNDYQPQLLASPDQTARFVRDMTLNPDLVQTVAVTCAMLGIPFRLTGVETLRIKETDRLQALTNELKKIGVEAETIGDHTLQWLSRRMPILEIPEFDTYGDHRMAMAFAPVAAYIPGIVIRDVEVVEKSYPGFWDDLRSAGFRLFDASLPIEEIRRQLEEDDEQ